jgi:putative transcriptional regulator
MSPEDIKALRARLGLSQERFCVRYRLSLGTLRNWEQGLREPDQSARLLLALIDAMPDQCAVVLERLNLSQE